MGNAPLEGAGAAQPNAASISSFYSPSAWIEGKAVEQVKSVAALEGVTEVATFPDLHPGKFGPVGSAILADRLYPQLIGNDIGCGMSLFALDLPARKIRAEKAAKRLRALDEVTDGEAPHMLSGAGLPRDLHPFALGTIGGGNHFCELQIIHELDDPSAASEAGMAKGGSFLLVHSGSRSLGTSVFAPVHDHPKDGVDPDSAVGKAYLTGHDQAVKWATLNRELIARRAARALRADYRLICDSPHNLIERHDDCWLHRKGAAKADIATVPLAGSRDSVSYLLRPDGDLRRSLNSLAHGAGRKYDRSSMHGRVSGKRISRQKLERTSFGGHVVCEDAQLIVEEAPSAYKNVERVLEDLASRKLAAPIATLQPVVTFKKTRMSERGDH